MTNFINKSWQTIIQKYRLPTSVFYVTIWYTLKILNKNKTVDNKIVIVTKQTAVNNTIGVDLLKILNTKIQKKPIKFPLYICIIIVIHPT